MCLLHLAELLCLESENYKKRFSWDSFIFILSGCYIIYIIIYIEINHQITFYTIDFYTVHSNWGKTSQFANNLSKNYIDDYYL